MAGKTYPVELHHPRIAGVTKRVGSAAAERAWRESGWITRPPRNPTGDAAAPEPPDPRGPVTTDPETTAAQQ